MQRTYLIQRLQKPYEIKGNEDFKKWINSFSFGGGLKDGGLSDEAMNLIKSIWRFDYMGSAEFEWGAVPESLSNIFKYCQKKNTVAGTITDFKKDIYYLCHEEVRQQVIDVIKELYKKDYNYQLKEPCHLKRSIEREDDCDAHNSALGWLELDNDFMFFIDKEMFEKTLELFGIKLNSQSNDKAVKGK